MQDEISLRILNAETFALLPSCGEAFHLQQLAALVGILQDAINGGVHIFRRDRLLFRLELLDLRLQLIDLLHQLCGGWLSRPSGANSQTQGSSDHRNGHELTGHVSLLSWVASSATP